jgi:hypothetical protein
LFIQVKVNLLVCKIAFAYIILVASQNEKTTLLGKTKQE